MLKIFLLRSCAILTIIFAVTVVLNSCSKLCDPTVESWAPERCEG